MFERSMIQERVRAGLARAKDEGKRLGRPPIATDLEKRIREALSKPGRPGLLMRPVESVAGVAETRDDVRMIVKSVVDRGRKDGYVRMLRL